ncbi:MAG: glycosyltransferase [Planctomycetota bacterium]|nr:glycosyltransferase [Planctomycetota bacterium]
MARRLTIAVFVEQFPSVSQTFVLGQVAGLLALGHEVTVFAAWGDPEFAATDVKAGASLRSRTIYHGDINRGRWTTAVALARNLWRHPGAVLDAVNVFKHGRGAVSTLELSYYLHWMNVEPASFDVIYCHFGPSGRVADRLRRAGFITGKIVTVFHAFDLTRYVHTRGLGVYRGLFHRGDAFVAITKYAREKLLTLGCPEQRISVLHAGVDSTSFIFRLRDRREGDPLQVLAVGRMVEKKGFSFALRALAAVRQRGYQIRAQFAGDGPLFELLKQEADGLGLGEVVSFLGPVSHERVRALTDEAHVMLVPSVTARDGDEEGLPAVLLEALAAGVPVIATRHAGIPEVIQDRDTGLLVAERDTEALAAALECLVLDRELYDALSCRGRAIVESDYDETHQTARLSAFLEDLVTP